jgi:hypothetical protein
MSKRKTAKKCHCGAPGFLPLPTTPLTWWCVECTRKAMTPEDRAMNKASIEMWEHLNELPWALRTGIDETAALILQEFLDGVSKKGGLLS